MHENMWFDRGHNFGRRTRRGDMAPIILFLLLDGPMHGYEIISRLDERSQGMWRPSAGSIYPNLQLLEEQEMVSHEKIDGKKVYTLTDKGKAEAEEAKEHLKDRLGSIGLSVKTFKELRVTLHKIRHDVQEIAGLEDEAKVDAARKILEEAEAKLNKLIN
jgi:DNA-binding PadR family transcriptional regulator